MFRVNQLTGFASRGNPEYVVDGLKLHLSADAYTSGQTWADQSGSGRDFYLGATSGSESSDMVHAAGPPAYFSSSGDDYFSGAAAYTGTILRQIGRSDTPFTLEAWVYRGGTADTDEALFSNMTNIGTSKGMVWLLDYSSNKPAVFSQGGERGAGTTQIAVSAWKHVALAGRFDGSVTCTHYLQGAANGTFTYEDTVFTSGDSADVPGIGLFAVSSPGSGFIFQNGTRIAVFRVYDRVLSGAEVLTNFNAERDRYGV